MKPTLIVLQSLKKNLSTKILVIKVKPSKKLNSKIIVKTYILML